MGTTKKVLMDRVIPPNQQPGNQVEGGMENKKGIGSILHIYIFTAGIFLVL